MMRNFNYSKLKDKKWDSESICYLKQIPFAFKMSFIPNKSFSTLFFLDFSTICMGIASYGRKSNLTNM